MGRRRRQREPVDIRIDRLDPDGPSGPDAEGRRWTVRAAPLGALLRVRPGRAGRAQRLAVVEPAPDQVEPFCPAFGLCGGCRLQESPPERQRAARHDLVLRLVGVPEGAVVHPPVEASPPRGYRNKLELSFSTRRFTAEPPERPVEGSARGSFLGFHPPGWYSKVVAVEGCPLGTPAMEEAIRRVARLAPGPAWDHHRHEGAWRHLVVRDTGTPEEPWLLATLVTTSAADPEQVRAVGRALAEIPGARGVLWVVNDRPADVATGELREVLDGEGVLRVDLGEGVTMRLPHDAFFQVATEGARRLFAVVAEAAGSGGTLLDLYCGSGAIGLVLARRFERIVGVERHEGAVALARENAAANGITGEWIAGAVEDVLPVLRLRPPLSVVVDPPRAGLHPHALDALARLPAERLVYVACNPAALARDRRALEAAGWRMAELWTVDLFPQTLHVEAVARFERVDRGGAAGGAG